MVLRHQWWTTETSFSNARQNQNNFDQLQTVHFDGLGANMRKLHRNASVVDSLLLFGKRQQRLRELGERRCLCHSCTLRSYRFTTSQTPAKTSHTLLILNLSNFCNCKYKFSCKIFRQTTILKIDATNAIHRLFSEPLNYDISRPAVRPCSKRSASNEFFLKTVDWPYNITYYLYLA
jgi:hypothetical protein